MPGLPGDRVCHTAEVTVSAANPGGMFQGQNDAPGEGMDDGSGQGQE